MSTQKIGRYEIERKLGEGGMAVVYLARDPLTKRQVAVKMLLMPSQQFEIGRQLRARFEREAEIVAALEHPHIVPIHDFGEHDGQPFIVMRYMTGGSLADRLKQRGRLSLAETAGIIRKLASALDDAHRRGGVHRDLKPANILFDGRGEPYVSDFGIAKLGEAAGRLTGTGAAIGTPAYMSPEQVRGEKELDGRSDVYSLGVVIFEMLTGQTPYNADTPGKLMLKHVLDSVPRISAADPTLPAGCDAIILRALAKSRDDRYANAGDLADDLTQLVAAATATAPTMIDAPPPQIDRPFVTPQPLPHTHTPTPSALTTPPPAGRGGRGVRTIAALVVGAILIGIIALGGAFAVSQFFNPVNRATATNAVAIVVTTPPPTHT
ncbi:MAG: serine/threonine protein kinase, partial [Chloroflexi bacterium]|nr:serine/threonine protein kinase [Chloroflexota bacterium]